jgi:hypothetical protein
MRDVAHIIRNGERLTWTPVGVNLAFEMAIRRVSDLSPGTELRIVGTDGFDHGHVSHNRDGGLSVWRTRRYPGLDS